ncbi:MAG: tetratricopeptide repeat protein, partial [Anaerolineales bacterium]|nr:tetratricopeptide repeat protein [Anaerolineales bacterium]
DALRRRVARGPLMIVLDDCHWLDPLSQDLLAFLGRNAADLPLLLLALYRPLEPEPLAWGQGHAHVGEIRLRELDPAEAEALIGHKLRQLWGEAATLPPALRERLAARAQGNPFYLEELLNFLRDRRGDPGDPQALAALEIPESLQSLILSRIDQLAEAAKTSLKVASVIGRVFRASWLWGSTPAVGAPAAVREHLEALSRLDLTPLSEPEPELAYMFKHITTQEVAYESLAYATRAALHEAVAGYVEQAYPAERAQFVDVLAFHYGRSANAAKQREYFRLAGDAAKAVYANAAAVDYYQRLLPLLPEAEQAAVRVDLGEVWQLTGEWAAAEAAYRQALAQAGADQRLLARAQAQLGSLLARTRSFDEALRWLREAQANCEAAGDRRGLGKVMEHMSFAHWNQGDFDRARTCAQLQLAIAAEHGDAVGMSGALDYLGITALRQGRFAEAVDHLQRAITTAQAAGYWRGAALAYNDLAGAYFMRDDFANALTHLQQALAAAGEIGYLQMQGAMLANASSLYKHQGEYAQALACCSQALRIALELGDQPGTLTRLGNLARIFQAQARAAEAERLFRRAIDLARALKLPNVLCTNLCDLGRLYLAHGRLPEALEAAEAAAAAAGQVNDTDTHREAEVLAVRARAALGALSPAEAGAALQAWLAAGELEEPDRALLHLALWQVDPARTADRAAAAELYAGLYAAAPVAEYADRYYALTGERLPAPPPLPPPPAALLAQPVDLPALLARAGVEAEAL